MATETQLQVMARHYLIAAEWADCEEGTHPRVTRQARETALKVCRAFVTAIGPMFDECMAREDYGSHPDCGNIEPQCAAMGHDLWLTSRGHGVGFWDRRELELGDLGDRLSDVARRFEAEYEQWRGWFYIRPYRDLRAMIESNSQEGRQ